MPLITPSYGGALIFGAAVSIRHVPNANAQQVDQFFGVTGTVTLFGGGRGRVFLVQGVLVALEDGTDLQTISDLNALESVFLSYADGIARTLIDTRGRIWTNVIFKGEFQPDPMGPKPTDFGWCIPYRAVFHGLT